MTHKSVRHISRQTGIARSSVHRIIKQELKLKSLRRQRAQELSEASKVSSLIRCKQLLGKFNKHMIPFIWFTDEKLFTVAAPINAQNDRLYVPAVKKKREVSAARLLHTRPMFSQCLMVSTATCFSQVNYFQLSKSFQAIFLYSNRTVHLLTEPKKP